jgi:hypothetical protein
MHTKESIKDLLQRNDRAVERALLAIYNRQTGEERQSGRTVVHNGVGFSAFDARLGSYYGSWIKSGKNLTGIHLDKGRRLASKYVGQLVSIANGGSHP